MSDTPARLAMMANQIARNFAVLGEAEAAAKTAEHIRLFWDPRMRAGLAALGEDRLDPPALRARALLGGQARG